MSLCDGNVLWDYPKNGQHCIQDPLYEPHLYYYWHGDIQEDYQMRLRWRCDKCFGDLLGVLTYSLLNPKWNDDTYQISVTSKVDYSTLLLNIPPKEIYALHFLF